MKKYVSGYSSTTTAPDSLATPTFEPRPTGRISEELEILCSALRQVGARQAFYGPNIHVVDTPKKCADALALMQEYYKTLRGGIGAVGFDSETTVYRTWESSTNNRTSILQIATEDVCLIVQLFYMTREGQERGRIPDILREFLEDPNQLKVGVSIENDAAELLRGYGLKVQGLVDLGKMALEKNSTSLTSLEDLDYMYGAEDWSVVKTDDIYRWDFDGQVLHRDAIWYSAVDALACKAIYENMLRNKYKSTYVPWEERFPMTPEEEYDDVIQFLHFKIKPKRIYPVDSIKILLTKSYPRLRQIHKPEKLNEIADNYIAKLLKDGVLVVDKNNASEEDLQLKPDQINATAYPGLALKFLYERRPQNKDQALKKSSTEPVDSPENLIASAVQEGDAQTPTIETIARDNTNNLASSSTEPKQNNPSSS
ncbi:hypothetical protein BGW42_002810 [Actinomortierella wolfii]|nr:hypothetical protein BGW42_002810 [Actinomortierella wolfii]